MGTLTSTNGTGNATSSRAGPFFGRVLIRTLPILSGPDFSTACSDIGHSRSGTRACILADTCYSSSIRRAAPSKAAGAAQLIALRNESWPLLPVEAFMSVPSLVIGLVVGWSAGTLLVWLWYTGVRTRLTNQLTAQFGAAMLGNTRREVVGRAMPADPQDEPEAGAMATIQSAGVCPTDQDNGAHVGYVIFNYRVAREEYSSISAKAFLTREEAERFVEVCRSRSLTARYRPECPQESCLVVDSDDMQGNGELESMREGTRTAVISQA
jgi:hypothetical protein